MICNAVMISGGTVKCIVGTCMAKGIGEHGAEGDVWK
jgi:hypothetical protein